MRIAVVGLLGLSMLKGCDFGDPQSVQPKMEEALRPYFPRVKAVALPQQQTIVGLSCLENVGDEMVKMVPSAVANNPAMSQLKLLRMFPGSSYSTVSIGFERSLAVYNIDTGVMGTAPMDATYAAWYRQQCGLDDAAPATYTAPQSPTGTRQAFVRIGHFTATISNATGEIRKIPVVDSLGMWDSDADFEQNQTEELMARKRVVRHAFSLKGVNLVHLKLDSVEKVPLMVK